MNIPPSEARALSIYDYEALIWHWNDRQSDDDDAPEPIDHATTQRLVDKLNARPDLMTRTKGEKPAPMPARL